MKTPFLESKLLEIIKDDVESGDITTSLLKNKKITATITTNSSGLISGLTELQHLFLMFSIQAATQLRDGARIRVGQEIFYLQGNSHDILMVERTALNILSRMSGVSTLTHKFLKKARDTNPKIKIAATRKTTPSFSYFEKRAVKLAGGDTHRLGLYDLVLLKDNHLKLARGIAAILKKAKDETSFTHKIEIEVSNKKEALEAAKNGADIIMLDNFTPQKIKETLSEVVKKGLRKGVLIEVSGGINLKNISTYAKTGVDIISIGALTHSAPALDFSLEVI